MPQINCPYLQNFMPQQLLTAFAGVLAESKTPWLKNYLIRYFINKYQLDLSEAVSQNINDYETFNQFFIRKLKPETRPICPGQTSIACPVDGFVAQIGAIKQNQLIQAKGFNFDLESLLGGDSALAQAFYDGHFSTLYLAPKNYHRIHMPITGTLKQSFYIPGKLFSVSQATAQAIPNLFSRNERLVTIFETDAGPMAVILVGAMIVGSIQTAWMSEPIKGKTITQDTGAIGTCLQKGEELGYFKLGSTVILLFGKQRITWQPTLSPDAAIKMGQNIGEDISQL